MLFRRFLSTNKKSVSFQQLISTDLHAHLIPNIDDGPKTIEESLILVKGLVALGYKKLIATPHVYAQYYPNTSEMIQAAFFKLQGAVEKAKIPVELNCAAEYYMDDAFEVLLKNKQILKLDNNRVLVETSLLANDPKLFHYLFNIQMAGLQPVLAHPERYTYLKVQDYERLIDSGCELQINLLSLEGHYGRTVYKNAKFLLKQKMGHFIGTDIHHQEHLAKLTKFIQSGKAAKILNNHLSVLQLKELS